MCIIHGNMAKKNWGDRIHGNQELYIGLNYLCCKTTILTSSVSMPIHYLYVQKKHVYFKNIFVHFLVQIALQSE